MKELLTNWVILQYRKVGELEEVRRRGYPFLLFSEVDHQLGKVKFYKPYYQICFPLQLFALLILSLRFVNLDIPVNFYNFLMGIALVYNIQGIKDIRAWFRIRIIRFIHQSIKENKEYRENFILSQINDQITIARVPPIITRDPESSPSLPEHITLFKTDVKAFCQKYFNISSPHFIRYYSERATDPIDKQIDSYFIDFSLLIPKRTELGADALRKILINPIRVLYAPYREAQINALFKDYSVKQIEDLFTNHHGKDKCEEMFNLEPTPIPVYRNFKHLMAHELFKPKILPSEILELEKKKYKQKIKVVALRTKEEYIHAGHMFQNCLKNTESYFTRGGYILTFYEENAPWACLWIKDQQIKEIKGVNNSSVDKYEIYEILVSENVIKP